LMLSCWRWHWRQNEALLL